MAGTDASGNVLRGLGIVHTLTEDSIIPSGELGTTYTQAEPSVGRAIPQGTTSTHRLRTSGSQPANSKLRVKTQSAAPYPGTLRWKYDADADTLWRGADVSQVTGWRNIFWADGSTILKVRNPHAASDAHGRIVAAAQRVESSQYHVSLRFYDPDADTWTGVPVNIYTDSISTTDGLHPCVAYNRLDGAWYVFHWVVDGVANLAGIRVHKVTWDGSAWDYVVHSTQALDEQIDVSGSIGTNQPGWDLGRIRAAFNPRGMLLLMAATVQHENNLTDTFINGLLQASSIDNAASLQTKFHSTFQADATIGSAIAAAVDHDVLVLEGKFVVTGFALVGTNDYIITIELPSATSSFKTRFEARDHTTFDALPNSSTRSSKVFANASTTGGQVAVGRSAVWMGEDGIVYAVATVEDGTAAASPLIINDYSDHTVMFERIPETGRWKVMGDGDRLGESAGDWLLHGTIHDTGDGSTYASAGSLGDVCGVSSRGRNLLLCQHIETGGTDTKRVQAVCLGGDTTLNLPATLAYPRTYQRRRWDRVILPVEAPENLNGVFISADTGTRSASATEDGWRVVTSTGQRDYVVAIAGLSSASDGYIALVEYDPVSGGDLTDRTRGYRFSLADGSDSYIVDLFCDDTGIRASDVEASTYIDAVTGLTTNQPVQILVAIADGDVSIWYRSTAKPTHSDRTWTNLVDNHSLTSGSTASVGAIVYGHSTSGTATTVFGPVAYMAGSDTRIKALASGFTNPNDLLGRRHGLRGAPVSIADGVQVETMDGGPSEGDEWHIDSDAEFPVRRLLPLVSPTPRVFWKDDGSGATENIGFKVNRAEPTLTIADGNLGNSLGFLLLLNTNIRTFDVWRHTGGTQTAITSVDNAITIDNGTVRNGGMEIPSTGVNTQTPTYVFRDEFAGAECQFGGSTRYLIRSHTEGVFDNIATARRPYFELAGTGAASSTATFRIIPRNVLIVFNLGTTNYRALGISVPAQTTYTGRRQIGTMCFGQIFPFGTDYSFGRSFEVIPGAILDEAPDGVQRGIEPAPARRIFRFSWTDPIDSSDQFGSSPAPDYLTASTTSGNGPVANVGDVPLSIASLFGRLGPLRHVVYLPRIPRSTSVATDHFVLNRAADFCCGTLDNAPQVSTVMGSEGEGRDSDGGAQGELMRLTTLALKEMR